MESTQGPMSLWRHHDELAARQTAAKITYMLDRFIPEACRGEAYDHIMELAYKEGFELTSKIMRKEYEAWKALTLKGLEPSSLSAKPGS